VTLFIKILRDADKLDLLAVETEHEEFRVSVSDTDEIPELPDLSELSKGALHSIKSGRCVRKEDVRTYSDLKLWRISWVFDFNFLPSLRLLSERGHVDHIADTLPDSPEIQAVRDKVKGYLESRLS
jgi:hypothetical protein